jgi:hypothetical protein
MAHAAFHLLESALRSKQLDRTLTTALPPLDRSDPSCSVATGVTALDACLRGGLPRGQLSEIAGPRSSGRTTVLMRMLAAATGRGEIVALIDTSDCLDVQSAADAGIDLTRLLWIRGQGQGSLERGLKALNLVLRPAALPSSRSISATCRRRSSAAFPTTPGCACSGRSRGAIRRAYCSGPSRWPGAPAA